MKLSIFFLTFILFVSNVCAQWQKIDVKTTSSFRGVAVVSKKIVWASGTSGTVIRTIDGGKNWDVIKVKGAEKLDFRDIEAFDANTAYILSIGNGESSRIYKTNDGGKNWNLQFKNTDKKAFFDSIAFWDRNNGIAQSDPVDGLYFLIATKDGGKTWKRTGEDKMPRAKDGEAAFAASGTSIISHGKKGAFIVSGGNDARVFRSYNRGLSWFVADTPFVKGSAGAGIFSIAMYDKKRGVIVGGDYTKPKGITNNLAFTKDGGKTWTLAKGIKGYRSGITYVSRKTIIAVGTSGSDMSKDGGKTWENLDSANYNAVTSKGKNSVWAVGPRGMVSRLRM